MSSICSPLARIASQPAPLEQVGANAVASVIACVHAALTFITKQVNATS
ncbi:MAG: hypothetical protein WA857_16775 [Candidatus Acidiferrum sp.]